MGLADAAVTGSVKHYKHLSSCRRGCSALSGLRCCCCRCSALRSRAREGVGKSTRPPFDGATEDIGGGGHLASAFLRDDESDRALESTETPIVADRWLVPRRRSPSDGPTAAVVAPANVGCRCHQGGAAVGVVAAEAEVAGKSKPPAEDSEPTEREVLNTG